MGGEATNILRTSIHSFFHGYPSFVSVASLLVFPFSAALLLSQSLTITSSSSLQFISHRIRSLFEASSFPLSSPPFSLLTPMLSQTLLTSLLTLPFTLTFLLLAQSSVALIARSLPLHNHSPPPLPSLLALYPSLLLTHLLNSFLLLSAHASVFISLSIAFATSDFFNLSSNTILSLAGTVLYSIVIAYTLMTCKLAIVVSAMEKCGGFTPIIKACILIKGRLGTALSIALPTNLAMAAVEALFQYRVARVYRSSGALSGSIAWEAFTIAYMHSFVVVVEILAGCLFYKKCRERLEGGFGFEFEQLEFEPEEKGEV